MKGSAKNVHVYVLWPETTVYLQVHDPKLGIQKSAESWKQEVRWLAGVEYLWSLQVVPNHSNDVNTLLLFALGVRPTSEVF